MRLPLILTVSLGALLLTGCGSGSTPYDGLPSYEKGTAVVTGEVVLADASETPLDGVILALRETGATVVTDADGSFTFAAAPSGTLTIDLIAAPTAFTVLKSDDAGTAAGESGGHQGDPGPHGDADGDGVCDEAGHQYHNGDCFDEEEIEDGEDAGDDEVFMHRVRAQERIHVRLRLEDGAIGSMECTRDQDRERETEVRMECLDASAVEGKLEFEQRQTRQRLRACVEHAGDGASCELWAIAPDGAEERVCTATANAYGEARWGLDTGAGARLPFGAGGLGELEGYRFQVRDAGTGAVRLRAQGPALPTDE